METYLIQYVLQSSNKMKLQNELRKSDMSLPPVSEYSFYRRRWNKIVS